MKNKYEQISGETFVDLINNLGVSPLVGEKTFNIQPGFEVRDASGTTYTLPYWDVIRRADDTYWSPLDDEARKTVYNVTDFQVFSKSTNEWLPMVAWFDLAEM